MSEQTQATDILVIGAGPAGLTAAIYSAWLGLKTTLLEAAIAGGKAWLAPKIENFPGFETPIKGSDLTDKMVLQAKRFGADIREKQEVVGLDFKGATKIVITRDHKYEASAVIFATGTQRRKLHIPGEAEFLGRGVSYCAVCDGPLFKRANVAVIGGSEEAVVEALHLSELAGNVLLVMQGSEEKIRRALLLEIQNRPNMEIVQGKVVTIEGTSAVEKIRIEQAEAIVERAVKGVFIALGGVPMTQIAAAAGVELDRGGCLVVDRQQKTNIEGVFAAGDCTCGGMQVVTAAGEGALAAMRAAAFVRGRGLKMAAVL